MESARSATPTSHLERAEDGVEYLSHAGVWKLLNVDDGGLTLRVVVLSSGCTEFQELTVAESDGEVRVDALVRTRRVVRSRSRLESPCTTELRLRRVAVDLDAPLGERDLLGECLADTPDGLRCDTFGTLRRVPGEDAKEGPVVRGSGQ